MKSLDMQSFTIWLNKYGEAWEKRDSRAAAALFTEDAEYFWTPFDAPQRGTAEIAGAWQGAVSRQSGVRFTFDVFAVNGNSGMARWTARFKAAPGDEAVELNGVLLAEFATPDRCRVFHEWWHMRSSPATAQG